MTPWAKIYTTDYKLDLSDHWQCESCGRMDKLANFDLHHIRSRSSMGGQKLANRIENIMCLCRKCHETKGDKKAWKSWLYKVHLKHMEAHSVKFDRLWIENQIEKHTFANRDQSGSNPTTSKL